MCKGLLTRLDFRRSDLLSRAELLDLATQLSSNDTLLHLSIEGTHSFLEKVFSYILQRISEPVRIF
jgi:hypothetical protein